MTRQYLTILLTQLLFVKAFSQLVINEVDPETDQVELKNISDSTVNISDWYLCSLASGAGYDLLSDLTLNHGSLNLAPGALVVFGGHSIIAQDDLALYNANDFSNSDAMVDYLQWGQINTGRSNVAEEAGLWVASDSANTITAGHTLQYDGDGQTGIYGYSLKAPTIAAQTLCEHGTPNGGSVFTSRGLETVAGTVGTDELSFHAINEGITDSLSYSYIITGEDQQILSWVIANTIADSTLLDFSDSLAGSCQVWGWSYAGLLSPQVGTPISSLNDNVCENISANLINVIKNEDPNSIYKHKEAGLKIYPNPAQTHITILNKNPQSTFFIRSLEGITLKSGNADIIEVMDLESGTYILEAYNADNKETTMGLFIKQ